MNPSAASRRLGCIDLALVFVVAFASPFFRSLAHCVAPEPIHDNGVRRASTEWGLAIQTLDHLISEFVSLVVLCYVLFRQRRTLRAIGLSFRWSDIPVSFLLALSQPTLSRCLPSASCTTA